MILSFLPYVLGYQYIKRHSRLSNRELFYLHPFLPSPLPPTAPRDQDKMGRKRASPGVDTEKNPFGDVELSDVHNEKLDKICDESNRVDIFLGTPPPSQKYIAS